MGCERIGCRLFLDAERMCFEKNVPSRVPGDRLSCFRVHGKRREDRQRQQRKHEDGKGSVQRRRGVWPWNQRRVPLATG